MNYFIIIISFLFSFSSYSKITVKEVTDRLDKMYRSGTSIGVMKMYVQTPDWKRTMQMEISTKGMNYTFVTINSPRKDAGVSTLKRESQMWNYFPKINKVIKIPPSMMTGSWMGSDFTNDDLVKDSTLSDDYKSKFIQEDDKKNYFIELTPKSNTVSLWDKIIYTVSKDELIPSSAVYYDERGEKVREMLFSKVKKFSNRKIPSVMTLVPITKKGHKTVIEYKSLKFGVKLDDKAFTRSNLVKRR